MTGKEKDHKKEEKLEEKILKEESKILEELESLKKLLSDKEDSYKRALADYINLKRRTEEEKLEVIKFANEVLLEKFIGIFNDLEEAVKHTHEKSASKLAEGLKLVLNKFLKTLKDESIEVIDPKGEIFDAHQMEAIESVEGAKGMVAKVYRKGFMLNGKVILPAMVAVGNGVNSYSER